MVVGFQTRSSESTMANLKRTLDEYVAVDGGDGGDDREPWFRQPSFHPGFRFMTFDEFMQEQLDDGYTITPENRDYHMERYCKRVLNACLKQETSHKLRTLEDEFTELSATLKPLNVKEARLKFKSFCLCSNLNQVCKDTFDHLDSCGYFSELHDVVKQALPTFAAAYALTKTFEHRLRTNCIMSLTNSIYEADSDTYDRWLTGPVKKKHKAK